MTDQRWELSKKYIIGKGLEIGALSNPTKVPYNVRVIYVDKIDSKTALDLHYPELKGKRLVTVDVLDDGEKLSAFPIESQDFIIGNHFLEHTQDPIRAIQTHLSRLRVGGILYYGVPDKRKTFDIKRPITPFSHVLEDYNKGPNYSYNDHLWEWIRLVSHTRKENEEEEFVRLKNMNYSIHFHVWDNDALRDFIEKTNNFLNYPFKICEFVSNDSENIIVLQKVRSENKENGENLLEIPLAIKALLGVYETREDLQKDYPDIKNLTELKKLIFWAKKYGVFEESSLTPYTYYFDHYDT